MDIRIQTAKPDDADNVCKILRASIQRCCVSDHRNNPSVLDLWLSNKTAPRIEHWFTSPSLFSAVATFNETTAGVCIMTRQGRIVLFYVAPDARRAGVGKALLQTVEAQAAAWRICVLQIHCTESARHFFARNGFHAVGRTRSSFGTNAIVLSKRLCNQYPQGLSCNCNAPA